MGYTIHDILRGDNEVSRLLHAFEEATGAPVEVRSKPWWLRVVSHPKLCVMIRETIYWADRVYDREWEALPTMSHELRHVLQKREAKRAGGVRAVLHQLHYPLPQLFAVFALLAFIYWPFVFALLFLLPWPSPWRMKTEAEAFATSRKTQRSLKMVPTDYSETLTSYKYWFPCWSREGARKRIEECEKEDSLVDQLVLETVYTYP